MAGRTGLVAQPEIYPAGFVAFAFGGELRLSGKQSTVGLYHNNLPEYDCSSSPAASALRQVGFYPGGRSVPDLMAVSMVAQFSLEQVGCLPGKPLAVVAQAALGNLIVTVVTELR